MEIRELQKKAIEIAQRYRELGKAQGYEDWSTGDYMQGFVGDVGDLAKLVMAENNLRAIPDHKQKIKHELADCLWSILILADKLNVDLDVEFQKTMYELDARITAQINQQL